MFELSLYSTIDSIEEINIRLCTLNFKKKFYIRSETIFYHLNSKLIYQSYNETRKIITRDRPEPNKKQETLCRKINIVNVLDGSTDLLLEMGYRKGPEEKLHVNEYVYESICIEFIRKDNEKCLVHLYTLTKNPEEGEKIVLNVCEQLKENIDFKKPPISWFRIEEVE